MSNQTVSTLWIGPSLGWIEQLCLKSFVAVGQPVKLYAYGPVENVPDRVDLCDAAQIWSPPDLLKEAKVPALIADIFRLHLSQRTDEIWIDTDMVALRPFQVNGDGYAVGFARTDGEVNNAVFKLPADCAVLKHMLAAVEEPDFIPAWMRKTHRAELKPLPQMERVLKAHQMVRAVYGPRALTHIVAHEQAEDQIAAQEVYYPIPWPYTDVLFSPIDHIGRWTTHDTQGLHLWKNLSRTYHFTHKPHPDSFLGKMVANLDVDVSGLKDWRYVAAHWQ